MAQSSVTRSSYLTLKQASEEFSIPIDTLRKWYYTRKLEITRPGARRIYVKRETLERLFEESTIPASAR